MRRTLKKYLSMALSVLILLNMEQVLANFEQKKILFKNFDREISLQIGADGYGIYHEGKIQHVIQLSNRLIVGTDTHISLQEIVQLHPKIEGGRALFLGKKNIFI